MSSSIVVQERGSVLEMTLNRPEKLNALDEAMMSGLRDAVARFAGEPALRVLLLRANGRLFCAGGDLAGNIFPDLPDQSPAAFRYWLQTAASSFAALTEQIERLQKPTVVAHQGPCIGAGLEISLAFDFRLAVPSANYSLPEIRMGGMANGGAITRLCRMVGPQWAQWLTLAGQRISAEKAERIGLVHALYAEDALAAETDALCDTLAKMPPEAADTTKLTIKLAAELGLGAALATERLASSALFFGREQQEGIAAIRRKLAGADEK